MPLSRNESASISSADGYAIALTSTLNMSEILYSQVGFLDGLSRVSASGNTHLLKNLSNSEYLITVKFEDGTDESIKLWSVVVPAKVSFNVDYKAGPPPSEESPYNGGDNIASSPLVGGDGKLIIRKLSFLSGSVAGTRPGTDPSVALLAVTQYDVILSDGQSIVVHSIAAADLAAADQEIAVNNYVQFEGTVVARNAVGVSAPSDPFQAKATNMLNKSGTIQVLADQTGAGSTHLRIKVPYPSDIAEQFEGDSLLDGTGEDSFNSSFWGGKYVKVTILNGNSLAMATKYEGYMNYGVDPYKKSLSGSAAFITKETYEEDTTGFTMFVGMNVGEIQQLKAVWTNKIGDSDPSDLSDLYLKMDRDAWVPTEYKVTGSVISEDPTDYRKLSGHNVQRISARDTVLSTGAFTGLWVDQASGIPVKNPSNEDDTTGTYKMIYMDDDFAVEKAHTSEEFFIALGADYKASLQLIENIPGETANGVKYRYDIRGEELSNRSIAISGLPSPQPGLTGRVVKEFSASGSELKFKLDAEASFGYNLPSSANVAIHGPTTMVYSGIDVTEESEELTLYGLTAGESYPTLQIKSTRAYSLSIEGDGLEFGLGVQSGANNKQVAVNSLSKGAEAIAADDHSDQYTSPSPFTSPSPLVNVILSSPADQSFKLDFFLAANDSGRPLQRVLGRIMKKHDSDLAGADDVVTVREYDDLSVTTHTITANGQNGSNLFAKLQVQNNSSTAKSDYKVSNIIVPFGNPTYTVTKSGKYLTASIQLNGRAMIAHMAFAVDPDPSSGDGAFLKEETDVPKPSGILGERLGSLNKQLLTKTWDFSSFSGDISKYYAKAEFEAGSADAVHNFN